MGKVPGSWDTALKLAASYSTENLMAVFSQTPSCFSFLSLLSVLTFGRSCGCGWFVCVLFNAGMCHLIYCKYFFVSFKFCILLLWPFCVEIQRLKDYVIITSIFLFFCSPFERELKYNDRVNSHDSLFSPYTKHYPEIVCNFHFYYFLTFTTYVCAWNKCQYLYYVPDVEDKPG